MFDIKEELKKLPLKPGVYIMKDVNDQVIYVGKAVKLKNRVSQYFQNSKNHSPKVQSMVSHIAEFEYIVTDTEMEALILECNLIKEYSPKYNIALKDDKTYPYIKVTLQEHFPRVFSTRRYEKDGARYFGPITDATAVKEAVEMVHKLWPIRKCKKVFPRDLKKERPCLNYHIGQCAAPCDGLVDEETYRKWVQEAILFLEGKHQDILAQMRKEMDEAAEALDFEKAALLRDKILSVERVAQKQKITNVGYQDSDVIGLARAFDEALVQVFFIRGGKITGREHFLMKNTEGSSRSQVMTEFIKLFYSGTAFIPKELLLEDAPEEGEKEMLEGWLSAMKGSKVSLVVPQKGEKHKLTELAGQNAQVTLSQFGEKIKREQQRTIGAMEQLAQALGLRDKVERVESYDISHIQGYHSVGSMVVFENGKAKKSDYRKFKIKTVVGANDIASMEEVLTRRVRHAVEEQDERFGRLPDLILMDGGKAQIAAAQGVLASFGVTVPVCGMVKDEHHRTRGLLYEGKEIALPTNSEAFQLITRIQDEVHRFAITYHRQLRQKSQVESVLDQIEGIGPKRRKALLRHFGDTEQIAQAEVADLLEVPEMTIKAAEAVYRFFRTDVPSQEAD